MPPSWAKSPITQGFGPTDEPLDGPYKGYAHFNKGNDYAIEVGTPIDAVIGGTVISAGDSGDGWGYSVKIKDENGYTHNYGHLSAVNVKAGDKITVGEVVGLSGGAKGSRGAGASTGPHLSYDVWDSEGDFIDPQQFLSLEAPSGPGIDEFTGGLNEPMVPNSGPKGTTRESGTIASLRAAEDSWYQFYNDALGTVKVVNGVVMKRTEKSADPVKLGALTEALNAETDPATRTILQSKIDELSGGFEWVEENGPGQRLYNNYKNEERLFGRAKEDSEALSTQLPAVRSYLDVEQDKTAEVTRQANDFAARSKLFSDLLNQEQEYNRMADDQNIQNAQARQNGTVGPGFFGSYANITGPNLLSQIIRPSIPDYVLPDYRLNQAVGLPGPQGFDDPQYPGISGAAGNSGLPNSDWYDPLTGGYTGWRPNSTYNMSGYAFGTERAGVDPELQPMLGKPFIVHANPLTRPWPWGGR